MLTAYLTATQNLLQNPSKSQQLYATSDLTLYVNTARGQLAGEAECIRFIGNLPLTAATRVYPFSAISLTDAVGIQDVLAVRNVWFLVGSGQLLLRPRPFEWFSLYELNTAAPTPGPPKTWAQYGQGVNGTIYVGPLPDQDYSAEMDCVCLPIPLVDDTTAEAIPSLWTDAVPYYAAYLALLSSQTGERLEFAKSMFSEYSNFVQRARRAATPGVLPSIYPQNPSPVRANQLGSGGGQQGAGG